MNSGRTNAILILLATLTVSCQDNKHETVTEIREDTRQHVAESRIIAQPSKQMKDASTCSNTIKKLVIWAKNNASELDSNPFIGYAPDSSYSVIDFSKTNQYLGFLRASGFFSSRFLKNQDSIYVAVNARFKREKEKEGNAPELSYNIVFLTQELDYDLSQSDLFSYKDKNQDVFLNEPERTLVFKVNSACLIDSIYAL